MQNSNIIIIVESRDAKLYLRQLAKPTLIGYAWKPHVGESHWESLKLHESSLVKGPLVSELFLSKKKTGQHKSMESNSVAGLKISTGDNALQRAK